MFAKRQSVLAATAGAPPEKATLRDRLSVVGRYVRKPPVAVSLAGVLLIAAAALFVTVLGDPRAGAPSARVALKRNAPASAGEPIPTGLEAFTLEEAQRPRVRGFDVYNQSRGAQAFGLIEQHFCRA